MTDSHSSGHTHGASSMERYGVPIERALRRREERARRNGVQWGAERVFGSLVDALLEAVPEGSDVIEVGPASGALTTRLLDRVSSLTLVEASETFRRALEDGPVGADPRFRRIFPFVDDAAASGQSFDVAVVTFTMRYGIGLLTLIDELKAFVKDRIVIMLDDDGSMVWAMLARAAALQGFGITLRFVVDGDGDVAEQRRAVVLTASVPEGELTSPASDAWEADARTFVVPHPAPRGTSTRLVRYFLAAGDRAVLIKCDPSDIERLYGNLRTAAHRLAFEEVTVRRMDDGVQLVRLPHTSD